MKKAILAAGIALMLSLSAAATQRAWEEVDRFPGPQPVEIAIGEPMEEPVSVAVRDGYVYVAVRQTTHVKLFTILGQSIIQQQLRPGIYRFRLGPRGIYLLKAGSLTRRITL